MSDQTQFLIPLFETGPDGAAFRVENIDQELQRQHMIQHQNSDLIVQADIHSITHGTMAKGGKPAMLLVWDFQFIGSQTGKRRFKEAEIQVQFGLAGKEIGDSLDPIVVQTAPFGKLAMDPSTETQETTVSADAKLRIYSIGIGAGFKRATTANKDSATILHGVRWISGRNRGKQNTARWFLWENQGTKKGIPSMVKTAMLVQPQNDERFMAVVTIKTKVDFVYTVKNALGRQLIDPVYFGAKSERKNMGPQFEDVVAEELEQCNLDNIGTASV